MTAISPGLAKDEKKYNLESRYLCPGGDIAYGIPESLHQKTFETTLKPVRVEVVEMVEIFSSVSSKGSNLIRSIVRTSIKIRRHIFD